MNTPLDRSLASSRRRILIGSFAIGSSAPVALAAADSGVSQAAESIHQEPVFAASRKRVYEALTDAKRFAKVVQLSAAMKTGMAPGKVAAEIAPQAGGPFSIFGGHIVGRNIELAPDHLIVQAWRVVDWAPGVFSIARFELVEHGSGTKIVFDHTGFPAGKGQHLAEGWNANYWQPLKKYLAS
ncbi:MAG: SRPBCC domain-containing protein [Bryobacteraceae bacterium]